MKKLILSVSAIAGLSLTSFAQGTITFDGSSAGHVSILGVADTTTDINAELLYSSTAGGTFSPLVTLLNSSSAAATGPAAGQVITASGDITFNGDGSLYDSGGQAYIVPSIAAGATAFFEVVAWTGQGSNPAAPGIDAGTSAVFSEVLTAASSPSQATINNMPALNLVATTVVPEPSTLAIAVVGLASMLMFCRKNK